MQEFIETMPLGQTGFRFQFSNCVLFIDPYLSNSVQELDNNRLSRLRKPPILPEEIIDADYVLITHEHLDHCDPYTLEPLYKNCPNCIFVCPKPVTKILNSIGIYSKNIIVVHNDDLQLGCFHVTPIPSAHPNLEIDVDGFSRFLGYIIKCNGKVLYHAGDTSVNESIIEELSKQEVIDIGFIPVNEKNYYRDRQGIIGNMSVREAFQFSEDIGLKVLVPTHWDMFSQNQVFKEEIELIYKLLKPSFEVVFEPHKF